MPIVFADPSYFMDIIQLNRDEYWSEEQYKTLSDEMKFDIGFWWVEMDWLEWHFQILEKCQGGILLYIENGNVLGQLDFIRSENYIDNEWISHFHIVWLLTSKKSRNKGVATKLIKYLREYTKTKITVDPEDHRSEALYRKFTEPYTHYSNYHLHFSSYWVENRTINKRELNYDILIDSIKKRKVKLEIGRYYLPEFDILQIKDGLPVKDLIWGDYEQARIFQISHNNSFLIYLTTPSLRIFSLVDKDTKDAELLLRYILQDLSQMGFNDFEVQIYENDPFEVIIKKIGFEKIPNRDPLFLF